MNVTVVPAAVSGSKFG